MITVCDDAPEQNKELKERGTSDAQRLCLRAVGELAASFAAGFSLKVNILMLAAYEQAQRALRIVCELDFARCAKGELEPSPQA